MKADKQFLGAISILVGTAVGAGIFGIPYVTAKTGFLVGMLYIFILGFIILLSTLFYGEITLRTKEKHQLPGYAEKYLGIWGKRVCLAAIVLSIYGALIAYTIEVGVFLHALFGNVIGGTPKIYSLVFFALAATCIYFGLKSIASIEKVMVVFLFIIIALIFIFGISSVDFNNFSEFDIEYILLPYGVILFALGAGTAIPDARFLLQGKEKKLFKAIQIGVIVPIVIYALFAFLVVGVTGKATTESSIVGLGNSIGGHIMVIGAIFGILAMTTSFLALGNVLRETFQYDFKVKKFLSWILVISIPLIIFLLNIVSFIEAIGFAGGILGGLEGILIILIFYKAKKLGDRKPEFEINLPKWASYILYCVFFGGIVYVIYEGLNKWVF